MRPAAVFRVLGQSMVYPSLNRIREGAVLPLQSWIEILLIEPIAVRVVWLILRVAPGVTPNMVTGISFFCALFAASLFLQGDYLLAALVYQLYSVLDNADGILARATDRCSRFGGAFDGLVNVSAYVINLGALFLSIGDERFGSFVLVGLFAAWALHLDIGQSLARPVDAVAASVVPDDEGFLSRNRLLYPLSFPDRHFILFAVGPLSGAVVACGCLVLAVEVASLLLKFRRLRGLDGRDP